MITYYDMTTGEWISVEEAEVTSPGNSRQMLPTPTPRLIEVHENVGSNAEKHGLPADIATLPVSVVLARWR
mgnify:CR=1 FL=1